MHNGVDSPVEEAVFGLEAGYPEWTRRVVLATATICPGEATQVRVLARRVPFAAPFRTRNAEDVAEVASTSKKICKIVLVSLGSTVSASIVLCCAIDKGYS